MSKVFTAVALCAVLAFVAVGQSGCAAKMDPPTLVATVATHGTDLMTGIKATQQAVIDAEKAGVVPTDKARQSMIVFQRIGANGEKAASALNMVLSLAPGSVEQSSTIQQIQTALDLVDSDLFTALVPIGDEATRVKVGELARGVSKTITLINRELLAKGTK